MTDTVVPTQESQQAAASVLKLFEHERRISVVEKDVERQNENISTLTKEVYALPNTLRDIIDVRLVAVQTDATKKYDSLADKLNKYVWYFVALLGGLVVDMIVHFLPHF